MKLQVLIATMHQSDYKPLLASMNLKKNAIIINQVPNTMQLPKNVQTADITFLSYKEKGLSRSRNKAIEHATANICVIADDDMAYITGFEQKVAQAYEKYPDADIIAFTVGNNSRKSARKPLKEGRLNLVSSMKISSVQLTFKRASLQQKGIQFNENFGAGSTFYMGEENIFLADCLRAGLKIYSVPVKIATLKASESTWFKGYTKEYFQIKGRAFYKISPGFSPFLVLQFALRKQRLYNKEVTLIDAVKNMLQGLWKQRNEA